MKSPVATVLSVVVTVLTVPLLFAVPLLLTPAFELTALLFEFDVDPAAPNEYPDTVITVG